MLDADYSPDGRGTVSDVFRKAGFQSVRKALETPFNLILQARL